MKWTQIFSFAKLFSLLFMIVFLTSGVFINVVQFILYLLLRPLKKSLYQKIHSHLSYLIYSQLLFLKRYWANTEVFLHTNEYDYSKYYGKENAIVIMNHSYEIDWLIGWTLCDHIDCLGSHKLIGKKSLKNIPPVGIAWNLGENIFLERNWEKDKNVLKKQVEKVADSSETFWLFLAAEGTRFTEEKREISASFAKKNGLPELLHHLTPRTKGFVSTMPLLRHKIAAIYNIIIVIKPNQNKPTITNIFRGKPIVTDVYIERIPIDQLPKSENDLSTWLYSLYKWKDDLFHRFIVTGSWDDNLKDESLKVYNLGRKSGTAINFFFWAILVLTPLFYFIFKAILSGNLTHCVSFFVIIGSFIIFQEKLIAESKITNASTYGVKKEERK